MSNPTALVLVDGHNLLWTAALGTPASITSRDRSRSLTGVFMFFALLRKAIRENLPDDPEVLVVFDGELGVAHRQGADPEYKANRPADTPLPIRSLPDVKRGLTAIDLPWIEMEAQEADDVIASAARLCADRSCYVFSRDRDFYQLLDDRVRVLNTARAPGRRIITAEHVTERFQVAAHQWCDRAALVGDPSDNIPGVRGIGPTTASRLLHGGAVHLEDLPGSGRLTGRVGALIQDHWTQVLAWRDLVGLRDDITLPQPPTGKPTPDLPRAAEVLDRLNLW